MPDEEGIKASDLKFDDGIWMVRIEVVGKRPDTWVPLASIDPEAAAFLSYFDKVLGDPETDEIIMVRLADPKNPQWVTIDQAGDLLAETPLEVKGYATKEEAKAAGRKGDEAYPLPDGSWMYRTPTGGPAPEGYVTAKEAQAAANSDERVYQLPDKSFWIKKADDEEEKPGYATFDEADDVATDMTAADPFSRYRARFDEKTGRYYPSKVDPKTGQFLDEQEEPKQGYETFEEAQAAADPDQVVYKLQDGSFWLKPAYEAPTGEGYATQPEAEAAIAGRTDLETYQIPDGSWALRNRQAEEPGQVKIVRGEDIDPRLAGQTFQMAPDGSLSPLKPPTLDEMLSAALMAGDVTRAIALDDFAKRPGGAEKLQMALEYSKSPLDYDLVLGMAQGTIPLDAPRYRAVDKVQAALGQLFPDIDARSITDQVVQSIQQPTTTQAQRQAVYAGMTGEQAEQAYRTGQIPTPDQVAQGQQKQEALAPGVPYVKRGGEWTPQTGPTPRLGEYTRNTLGQTVPQGPPPLSLTIPEPRTDKKPYVGLSGQLGPSGAPILAPSTEDEKAANRARNRQQAMALAGPRGSIPEYTPLDVPTKNVHSMFAIAGQRPLSAQDWGQMYAPEQQRFIGGLQQQGISESHLDEYIKQWEAATLPGGTRRKKITSAARSVF